MRKQARRLWLGDWQQREDKPEQADTVTILPVEDEDEGDGGQAPVDHRRRNIQRGVALGALALVIALALALSSGNDKPLTSERSVVPPAQTPQAQPQVPQTQIPQVPQGGPGQGFGGPDLTGPEATKAAEAALSKYPGDIERVTRDSSGSGYVVHVIQPDGNEVHVLVDGEFHVEGSDAGGGPRNLGPGTSQ
jgi:hypothetical protein